MGYADVQLNDTTGDRFMTHFEANWMALGGSTLLIRRK